MTRHKPAPPPDHPDFRHWPSAVRFPAGIQAAPPGHSTGLFADVRFAAQAPGAGAPIAPGLPGAGSLRRRLVFVDFRQLDASTDELTLNLFDDTVFDGLVERSEPTFSGGYALSGRLAGVEHGAVTLVVNGGVVAGLVWTPDATYRLSPAGGGLHAIQQVDPGQSPPPGDPLPRPLPNNDRRDPLGPKMT